MSEPLPSPSLPSWLRYAPWMLIALSLVLHLPYVLDAGWAIDDTRNLQQHVRHGDLAGEWTTPTYTHAGGEQGHIWRPIPASIQHLLAMSLGREAWVFRGLNLGLHLLNIGLLFGWLRSRRARPEVAGLLVMAWAFHPALIEAVAWSSDVYDLMACSAALAMFWGLQRLRNHWARCLCLGLGVLAACLCKESAVALVGVVWVLLWLAPPEGLRSKTRLGLGGSALAGALLWTAWHGQITTDSYALALSTTPLVHQLQAWLSATGWLLLVPGRAWTAHLFDPSEWLEPLMGGLTLGGLGLAVLFMHRRAMPEAKTMGLAALAWMGLLLPAGVGMALIGIQPLRYAYLPLALFVGLLAGLSPLIQRHGRIFFQALGTLSLVYLTLSFLRLPAWKDDLSLWTAELSREPENPYAMRGMGRAWIGAGQEAAGVEIWEQAVDLAPDGNRLFSPQEERYLLAQTALGLALQERLAIEEATRLSLEMSCQMLDQSQSSGQSLPRDFATMVSDSFRLRGVQATPRDFIIYCSETGSDARPDRSE